MQPPIGVQQGGGGKRGQLSPFTQGLAHTEAHALQDRQAHLLSLKGRRREAQGPSAPSKWELPGIAAARGLAIPPARHLPDQDTVKPVEWQAGFTPPFPHLPPQVPSALRTSSPLFQEKWECSPH